MNKILLTRATIKDQKEIAKMEKLANSKTYAARTSVEEIEDFIKNNFVFIVKNGNEVIGLAAYEELKRNTVHINGLIITKKFRGQGFARQTMNLLLKKMLKYSRIELVVHPHNNKAVCLYLSLGFFIESWRDNYFGDGEPRLMLVKK
ncbi:MAG: GNAT family N-acetyltransferase [Planctomycetes bacterium]|jgi:ribosomal protein S18 acetylase RimI-like enzyme|nr:GNAT family N-acetyltransferase [Planctomycetota bacterium]